MVHRAEKSHRVDAVRVEGENASLFDTYLLFYLGHSLPVIDYRKLIEGKANMHVIAKIIDDFLAPLDG